MEKLTMQFPDLSDVHMREIVHGTGRNGFIWYRFEDTGGLRIYHDSKRESRKHPWIDTWWSSHIAGRTFPTAAHLLSALASLTDEQVAAERAKYPMVRSIGAPLDGNKCRLCPHDARLPAASSVHLAKDWEASHDYYFLLCTEHQAMTVDPVALEAAILAEVEARRKRAADREAARAIANINPETAP